MSDPVPDIGPGHTARARRSGAGGLRREPRSRDAGDGRDDREARVVPLYALAPRPPDARRRRRARGDDADGPPTGAPAAGTPTGNPTGATAVDVPWEAIVTVTRVGLDARFRLRFEQGQIVDLCRRPVSVAEVAAYLRVPLGVARLLVAELRAAGMVTTHVPRHGRDGRPSGEVLDRLLAGLRAHAHQPPPAR